MFIGDSFTLIRAISRRFIPFADGIADICLSALCKEPPLELGQEGRRAQSDWRVSEWRPDGDGAASRVAAAPNQEGFDN